MATSHIWIYSASERILATRGANSQPQEATDMSKGDNKFEDHYQRQQDAKKDRSKNLPGEDDEPLPPPVETFRKESAEPGRNDPCHCGSGKKYKQCCINKK